MTLKSVLLSSVFVMGHVALVAPFVPLANIVPASLGALAITSMASSLILAARWRIVDRLTGGPDKSYALHRYFGFFALLGTLGHWALASSLGAGIFPGLAETAEGAGSVAAFGLLGMTGAAMVRAIPYHLWKLSHMLMGPVFALSVFHTFIVASPLAVGSLPWLVLAGVSGLGLLGWAQTLLRKRSLSRLMTVETATPVEGGMDVTLRSESPLPHFRAGQFATVAWNEAGAEAHPFTIAGGDDTSRRFVIRAAGDWTSGFVGKVAPGTRLRVGRGEGRFLPKTTDTRPHQLWVAGGVGITPFLAALERMTPDQGAPVTLIYCVRTRKGAAGLRDLERHAARLPQLDLIVVASDEGEHLSGARLAGLLRNMPARSQAYLCGPEGLKDMVTRVWRTTGMTGRIHSERFDFRGAYGLTELRNIGKPMVKAVQDLAARLGMGRNAVTGS